MSFCRIPRISSRLACYTLGLLLSVVTSRAEAPVGYYSAAEGKAGTELRAALHAIIRNHQVIPYSSSSFDTSDALKILDQSPTIMPAVGYK